MGGTRALFASMIVAGFACTTAHAGGVNYLVTRFDDPAPGACEPNDCSLREAVMASAEDPEYDAITLPAGTFHVGAPKLVLSGGVRFYGEGPDLTHIVGDGSADLFAYDDTQQMSMEDLSLDAGGKNELVATISNGVYLRHVSAPNPLGKFDIMGSDGSSFSIGASDIRAEVACSGGDLCLIYDSTLVRLRKPAGPLGGGAPEIVLEHVLVDGALAPGATSGISINSSLPVKMSYCIVRNTTRGMDITGSLLSHADDGDVQIIGLDYSGNEEPLRIGYRDLVEISDSAFRDNIHDDAGDPQPGALWADADQSDVRVQRSLFSGNRGSSSAGGAALVEGGAKLTISNSTFSNNNFSAAAAVQPGGVRGAAVGFISEEDPPTSLTLRHVTIAGVSFAPNGVHGTALGGYGGNDGLNIAVLNTILRGSCALDSGAIDVASGNIESAGDTCNLPAGNQSDVSTSALALGTLAAHGGHTDTYLPDSISVAVDAGDEDYCLDEDQRGYARAFGSSCDVGAVEAGDVIFAFGHE